MYRSFLTFAMRAKWLTIAVSLALFAASVLALPLIPRQFFPSSDRPELLVDVSLPQNASIYASEAAAKRLDAALSTDPDVARWSTYVGRGAIRFYLPLNVQLPNDFLHADRRHCEGCCRTRAPALEARQAAGAGISQSHCVRFST